MDEQVENVLLQSLMVVFHILPLSHFEGVVAVREDDGGQLVLIVQEVAAMEMCDGNLVLTPEFEGTRRITKRMYKIGYQDNLLSKV